MKQTFLDRVRESLTAAIADFNREDVPARSLVIFPDKPGEPGKGARFEITVPKGAWRITGKDE